MVIHPLLEARLARAPEQRLAEAAGLAQALDLIPVKAELAPLRRINPATFFGEGRVEAIQTEAQALGAFVLIVDAALSPVQQRNLERALNMKVIDRSGLILEIFGRRARTREGRLQVELARLGYERSRLVKSWTHLDRQRSAAGTMGGPGETQLELDRRRIAARITKLKLELEEVRRTRGLQRAGRRKAGFPAVALIGYTNAGKSSLFNRLTEAGVFAKDMPFATLDPTARLVAPPSRRPFILSDTVGFITDLPHELVAAFRATLEEVAEADVMVHVRDIAHDETDAQKADVLSVLEMIVGERGVAPPIIEAWNKADLLSPAQRAARAGREEAALISARSGEGVAGLLERIDAAAYGPTQIVTLTLDSSDGRARAWIAERGRILEEHYEPDGRVLVTAELTLESARQAQAWSRSAAAAE